MISPEGALQKPETHESSREKARKNEEFVEPKEHLLKDGAVE